MMHTATLTKARAQYSSRLTYQFIWYCRAFHATDATWKQFWRDWCCQAMDSVLPHRAHIVGPCRMWNVYCHQLFMWSTIRIRTGPIALRRLHMPSSQHHNSLACLSISTQMTHNCILHCQNLTWINKLQNCLSTVHLRFSQNGLVINPEKSRVGASVNITASKSISITTDRCKHRGLCGAVHRHHQNFGSNNRYGEVVLLPYLSTEAYSIISNIHMARTVACALVNSHLDYANSVLYGTSVANIAKLQRVQNALTRVIQEASWSYSSDALKPPLAADKLP